MKTKLFFIGLFFSSQMQVLGQIDPEFYFEKVEYFDPNGLIMLKDDANIEPGEIFSIYKDNFLENPDCDVIKIRERVDYDLGFSHTEYQQTYLDIPMEGAIIIEHSIENQVKYLNGNLCNGINQNIEVLIDEQEALSNALSNFPERQFKWEDEEWEQFIKEDLDDTTATFYPAGELVWALDSCDNLGYLIFPDRYTICYRFEIFLLEPYEHLLVLVNARNGEIHRVADLVGHNGPGTTLSHGVQTLGTKEVGILGNRHFELINDDNGFNIETREGTSDKWSKLNEVKNNSDNWINHPSINAMSAHYYMTEAWRYFVLMHQRWGFKDNSKKIRVKANSFITGANYKHYGGNDYVEFGYTNNPGSSPGRRENLDVAGHEFAHGINYYVGQLGTGFSSGEAPSIFEGFADIFGFLTEWLSEGYTINDWHLGEDGGLIRRDMETPGNQFHPDTYKGARWYPDPNTSYHSYDNELHINNGPFNKWFNLIVAGGSHNGISVNSIGIQAASDLVYYLLTVSATNTSDYSDFKSQSFAYMLINYGICDSKTIEVEKAWEAIGVGSGITCPTTLISEINTFDDNVIYNSYTQNLMVGNFSTEKINLTIYNVLGQKIESGYFYSTYFLGHLIPGSYIVHLTNSKNENKVIKLIR